MDGEVDDLLAVEGADRRLLVVEHAQLEVGALLLEFVQLIGEKGERIGAGSCSHESLREEPAILAQAAEVLCALEKGRSKTGRSSGSVGTVTPLPLPPKFLVFIMMAEIGAQTLMLKDL